MNTLCRCMFYLIPPIYLSDIAIFTNLCSQFKLFLIYLVRFKYILISFDRIDQSPYLPPWLSGRALDKNLSLFWLLEGPWFESRLRPTFLVIFGHFIPTLPHQFEYKKLLLFLQKGNKSQRISF